MSPQWRRFLQNLGWYLATLVVLAVLLRYLRSPVVLLALWGVGLVWGGWLAYRLGRLLFPPPGLPVDDEKLEQYLSQARAYRQQIERVLKSGPAGEQPRREALIRQVETWTEAVTRLVERLQELQQDDIIRRDLRDTPRAIAALQTRLARETDPGLKAQLERTLASRQKQLTALEDLQHTMARAEMQIESALSMLGAIYSQLLTGQSTSQVADYSRLAEDVDEEVQRLHDHLEALREVKLER